MRRLMLINLYSHTSAGLNEEIVYSSIQEGAKQVGSIKEVEKSENQADNCMPNFIGTETHDLCLEILCRIVYKVFNFYGKRRSQVQKGLHAVKSWFWMSSVCTEGKASHVQLLEGDVWIDLSSV